MSDPKKTMTEEPANLVPDRRGFLTATLAGSLGLMLGGATRSEAQGCSGGRHRLLGPEEAQAVANFLFGRSRAAQSLDAKLKADGYTKFVQGAFAICSTTWPPPEQPIVVIPYAKLTGAPPSTDAGIVILPPAFAKDNRDLPSAGLIVRYGPGPGFMAEELGLLQVAGGIVRETTVSAAELDQSRTDDLTRQLFGKEPYLEVDRTLNSVATFGALDLAAMPEAGKDVQASIQDVLRDADFWTKSVDLLVISDLTQPPLAIACCSCCCSCSWHHKLEPV